MSELEPEQYFSPEEVNALIPRLEEHFQRFWVYRENAQIILHELRKRSKDDLDMEAVDVAQTQIRQSQAHFLLEQAKGELDAILAMGGAVKDLEIGLVDFLHYISEYDETVHICWRYGEKKVRFWHGLNEGFNSRKPLIRNKTQLH